MISSSGTAAAAGPTPAPNLPHSLVRMRSAASLCTPRPLPLSSGLVSRTCCCTWNSSSSFATLALGSAIGSRPGAVRCVVAMHCSLLAHTAVFAVICLCLAKAAMKELKLKIIAHHALYTAERRCDEQAEERCRQFFGAQMSVHLNDKGEDVLLPRQNSHTAEIDGYE